MTFFMHLHTSFSSMLCRIWGVQNIIRRGCNGVAAVQPLFRAKSNVLSVLLFSCVDNEKTKKVHQGG